MEVQIKVVNNSPNALPAYETSGAAGMDLRAWLDPETSKPKCYGNSSFDYWDGAEGKDPDWVLTIPVGDRVLIPTGLHIQLPAGYEAQIRPRSGLALKHGITCLNTPGTIDADYTGDVGVILINLGDKPFEVRSGDRIAQMIIAKYDNAVFEKVEVLDETERGDGGFGHTGKK